MEFITARISPSDVVDALARLQTGDQDSNDLVIVETWVLDTIDYVARLEEVVKMYKTLVEVQEIFIENT